MPSRSSGPRPLRIASRALSIPVLLLGLLILTLLASCGPAGSGPEERLPEPDNAEDAGDLEQIRLRGQLRILLPSRQFTMLTRSGFTSDHELELARSLAHSLGLSPVVTYVGDREQLFASLENGSADLVIARLTETPERKERVAFSTPVDHVREMLVTRRDVPPFSSVSDLAGHRIAVRKSSSFFVTVTRLQQEIPFEIVIAPESSDTEELIYGVAMRDFDATVADEDLLKAVMAYRDDVRAALPLSEPRPIAWALPKDMPELKAAVDQFLREDALTAELHDRVYGDLAAIQQRKVLRVLTRNNAASYFLYRGGERGFEFDLAKAFARKIGCRLQVVLPPDGNLMIPWLLEGRGDLIAASMTIRDSRSEWVNFSEPYLEPQELIVVRAEDDTVHGMEDLRGRKIHLRRSSSYFDTLEPLQQDFAFELVLVPSSMETEELIAAVANGEFDITVADSHILAIELAYRKDVKAAFPLGNRQAIGWAVRREDHALLAAADEFLSAERGGTFFNVLSRKYFEDEQRIRAVIPKRSENLARISPFDQLFRDAGQTNDIDWRLLAAQAFEESNFDGTAMSRVGAQGVMQVMPGTAEELGVEGDLHDPQTSIEAGSRYLRQLMDRFEMDLPLGERLRFALASYNAGRGHIQDGRRLARERGLDPDKWFGNVATVLPLLSQRRFAARSRYGYCRCRQPVAYVRAINDRYAVYTRLFELATGKPKTPRREGPEEASLTLP